MAKDGKDLILRFIKEVFDNKNVDAIDEFIDAKAVDRTPWPGYGNDRAEVKRSLSDFFKAFPDLKTVIDDVIAEGNKVVIRSTMSGTNTGEFMGMPPTGKKVEGIGGIDIVEIKGDKLGDHWGYVDSPAMMAQLGLMAPPA
jgi:steroid delta-isomerase-like uncharacterized protein